MSAFQNPYFLRKSVRIVVDIKLYDLVELMRGVKERIKLWTDIPVSVGIAPSKTLAKMGSKFAKQYKGYNGVCMIDTEAKRRKALGIMYKRSGVMAGDIVPSCPIALDMFDPIQNRKERKNLMKVIDSIKPSIRLTIQLGVEGEKKQPWKVKYEHRSPNYLTDINDILTVKI